MSYYELELSFVFQANADTDTLTNEVLTTLYNTNLPSGVLDSFLQSSQMTMEIQNTHDELSYIRITKVPFPPPPIQLTRREPECSVAIIFPETLAEDEVELGSQDSPRSSEDGTVGSLVDFIVSDE